MISDIRPLPTPLCGITFPRLLYMPQEIGSTEMAGMHLSCTLITSTVRHMKPMKR
jgi:hypothetical protein